MKKLELYARVAAFRRAQAIPLAGYPVSAPALARELSITVETGTFVTPGLRAAALPAQSLIILDARLDAPHRNFYCAHELCHHLWHADTPRAFRCFDATASGGAIPAGQDAFLEWQANEGAAELLVPMAVLLPTLKKYAGSYEGDRPLRGFTAYLAAEFGVPRATISLRFDSLRYEIRQYLAGIPLKHIKVLSAAEQRRRGIRTKSLNELYLKRLPAAPKSPAAPGLPAMASRRQGL